MTDPIEEGKAFAAMLGKGPAQEAEQPTSDEVAEPAAEDARRNTRTGNSDEEVQGAPVEDALITALRQQQKPWDQAFVEMLHPPDKGES